MSSDEESQGIRRSRRSRVKSSKNQDALEKLKQLRREGRVNRVDVDELVPDLYDEVDEIEYAEKFTNDFVVDDDGSGYVDNGQDDEEDEMVEKEDNEKERKKKDRRAGKVKKGALDNYFSAVLTKQKDVEPVETKKIDEDLNAMLAEIAGSDNILDSFNRREEEETHHAPNPFKRNLPYSPEASYTPPIKVARKQIKLSTPKNASFKKVVQPKAPSPPPFDHNDDFDDDGGADFDIPSPPPQKSLASNSDPTGLAEEIQEELKLRDPSHSPPRFPQSSQKYLLNNIDDSKVEDFDEDVPAPAVSLDSDLSKTGYFADERALRFFWFDSYEDEKHPGKVYLFGFVKKVDSHEFESCCVTIDKILHRIYFVPREIRVDTDQPVTLHMVYDEVNDIFTNQYKFSVFKSKPVSKKFAFMDGVTPEEARCLEVCYDPIYPIMPAGPYNGKTFSRIANATVTAMERLLVERNIRGPCWLEIRDVNEIQPCDKISYCQREFKAVVSKVELDIVNVMPNMQSLPPCKMMALNMITVANPKNHNKPEIVMITVLRTSTYFLDKRSPTKWEQKTTYICSPPGTTLPFQFQQDAAQRHVMVEKFANEKSLLQKFLGYVKSFDPDVVIGHDLASQMSILRDRLEDVKLTTINWGFMGRLKRHENLKHCPQNKRFRWTWTAGRLYLDSKSAAMELVHSQSFDLGELVENVLHSVDPKAKRVNVDSEQIRKVFYENGGNTADIFNLIQWNGFEAQFAYRILAQLNAMQLFLQITQIVGGILSRTLMGGRAERNEYLLLHAFYREGYISPDKLVQKPKGKAAQNQSKSAAGEKDEKAVAQSNSKKPQYTGGLVLEPKKGFYQTYIILLDFNSLYPSIIQEYKLCFTTVKMDQRNQANENELPAFPDPLGNFGILPAEIAQLVQNRRAVKNDMKKITNKNSEAYKQMDIRQLGLKLTANSMYGCLGFDSSRFCAKTIAAMVTFKGREILERTKNVVEASLHEVIYGDTDSIMVDTKTNDLEEALRIGREIKKKINASYKKLELDIDGVYKRLLLLKKKKYAGLAVDLSNPQKTTKELKGLDIVRRDWSGLAKEVGTKVVDIIFDSIDRDEMVEKIRNALAAAKDDIENNRYPLEKYEILKTLASRPEEYHNAKGQPHVSVALRLNQTRNTNLRKNDVVRYIICDDGSTQAATQRAYAKIEIEANQNLKIDNHYYLAHEIHPIVERLCEPIEELDACQIAEALGLDGTSYRRRLIEQAANDDDENTLPGIIFDFQACDSLPIKCPNFDSKCRGVELKFPLTDAGKPALAECSCGAILYNNPVEIELQIIKFLQSTYKKYTEQTYTCRECEYVLTVPPLFKDGSEYPCPQCCNGYLRPTYTQKRLFDQQKLVHKIVNFPEWYEHEATKEQRDTLRQYYDNLQFKDISKHWANRVQKFIDANPYTQVDLSRLFAPMKLR